jgi:hypothetical protein
LCIFVYDLCHILLSFWHAYRPMECVYVHMYVCIMIVLETVSTCMHIVKEVLSLNNVHAWISRTLKCALLYILRGFKTSDNAFWLSYSIAFDCSICPFLECFHSWLCIFHLPRFSEDGLVFSFLQVSSES